MGTCFSLSSCVQSLQNVITPSVNQKWQQRFTAGSPSVQLTRTEGCSVGFSRLPFHVQAFGPLTGTPWHDLHAGHIHCSVPSEARAATITYFESAA